MKPSNEDLLTLFDRKS